MVTCITLHGSNALHWWQKSSVFASSFVCDLQNITIVIVAYGERLWYNGRVTTLMLISFVLMIISSIAGGWNDITFDFYGYFWMICNCFSAAAFVLRMRGVMKEIGFKDLDTLFYNNVATAPLFFILGLITEDCKSVGEYYLLPENSQEMRRLVQALLLSGISAFSISYCSAWCLRVTNSTTYSLIGALNKLPLAIIGMLFFHDPITVGGSLAVMLGLTSGLVYTYAKNQQRVGHFTGKPRALSLSKLELTAEGSLSSGHRQHDLESPSALPGTLKEEVYGQSGSIVSQVRRI